MTATPKGSTISRRLALRYVMKHPIGFREYFVPRVRKVRYWHRYSFSPILLAMDQGDTVFAAGRAVGKSFTIIEPELVRHAISHPGEESMVTSLRKMHVSDRMERVIDYFEHPILAMFVRHVGKAPTYHITLHHGHMLYGISVGDDAEARMVQGKHVGLLVIEEAHQYPMRGWIKLQGAKDAKGCRTLMAGVPDGRIDTPFRYADSKYDTFIGRRFHLSRRTDPYFNEPFRKSMAEVFGGENSDRFLQEMEAEWGSPSWSAWDLEAIQRCMSRELLKIHITASAKMFTDHGLTASVILDALPGPVRKGGAVIIAADIGYSQPSEAAAFQDFDGIWHMIARVSLVDRMEHDDQALIIGEFARRYGAALIGLDATEGEGRAIATELERLPEFKGLVRKVSFVEKYLTGWTENKETGLMEEDEEFVKPLSTRKLRELWARQELIIPVDDGFLADFNKEVEYRSPSTGKSLVKTPEDVHVTDMCRVFAMVLFIEHPPEPEERDEFNLPEFGEPDYARINPQHVII